MRISISDKPRPCARERKKPTVCITMGYPAGIGPEIIVGALASQSIRRLANFLIVGDGFVFRRTQRLCRKKLAYNVIRSSEEIDFSKKNILFFDLAKASQARFSFGKLNASYGKASIDYIEKAVSLIKSKKADLLITAPIHKHAAELSGFKYPGHTEYLAHLSGTKDFAMMFAGGPLRIVLATTHIPIEEVSQAVSRRKLCNLLALTHASLKRYFGLKRPRIAVCGLNPHAGEGGILGDEEIKIIAPAIKDAKKKNINAYGPVAADSVFYDLYKGRYDCAICMYHDQGIVALKMIARDKSVNITLGLPFIRTSPAHGTALDIAGKNLASCESMKEAIKTAISMYNNQ